MFDHFVGLALKGLTWSYNFFSRSPDIEWYLSDWSFLSWCLQSILTGHILKSQGNAQYYFKRAHLDLLFPEKTYEKGHIFHQYYYVQCPTAER